MLQIGVGLPARIASAQSSTWRIRAPAYPSPTAVFPRRWRAWPRRTCAPARRRRASGAGCRNPTAAGFVGTGAPSRGHAL
jgi:hypothetical protein